MKILVLSGNSYGKAVEGLGDIVYDPEVLITEPENVKLVLFTGGEDVSPSLYNHSSPKGYCAYNKMRDKLEVEIFKSALDKGIRTVGICRGSQFINVMAGGTLIHHVENHAGPWHNMKTLNEEIIRVNSLHHQMIIPPHDSLLIGWAEKRISTIYYGNNDEEIEAPEKETEAVLFPNIESAGVQYHPEMMSKDTNGWKWFNTLAKDLIEIKDFYDIIDKYGGKICMKQGMSQ